MTIIISQQDAESPRIGYENLFESASSVIASSEAAGYAKENAYDWRLYDWWKPATTGTHYLTAEFSTAVTADYLAIFGHDLHKWGASAQLQYGMPAQNLLTWSEQFDNAAWIKSNATISTNVISAPDGTITADKFIPNNSASTYDVYRAGVGSTLGTGINGVFSIYVKAAEITYFRMSAGVGFTDTTKTVFDVLNGVVVSGPAGAAVEYIGNGWYRCSRPLTYSGSGDSNVYMYSCLSDGARPIGDGVSGLYIWGGQLEQAAQVGPYIQTTSSPITSGTAWLDATTAQAPTTGKVIFTGFDSISAAKWRVKLVTPTGPASLGMVAFGQALIFPRGLPIGFEPPNLARKNEYLNNQGDTGAFLGRSLRRYGADTSIEMKLLDPAWVRETWHPFQKHAEKKPFFFSWDYLNHPDEAAFCWTDGDVPAPRYEHAMYMSVSMKLKALTELA